MQSSAALPRIHEIGAPNRELIFQSLNELTQLYLSYHAKLNNVCPNEFAKFKSLKDAVYADKSRSFPDRSGYIKPRSQKKISYDEINAHANKSILLAKFYALVRVFHPLECLPITAKDNYNIIPLTLIKDIILLIKKHINDDDFKTKISAPRTTHKAAHETAGAKFIENVARLIMKIELGLACKPVGLAASFNASIRTLNANFLAHLGRKPKKSNNEFHPYIIDKTLVITEITNKLQELQQNELADIQKVAADIKMILIDNETILKAHMSGSSSFSSIFTPQPRSQEFVQHMLDYIQTTASRVKELDKSLKLVRFVDETVATAKLSIFKPVGVQTETNLEDHANNVPKTSMSNS